METTVIERMETGIVRLLKAQLPSHFYIDRFPARPDRFDRANYPSAALVHFSERKYDRDQDTSCQTTVLVFNIILLFHNLKTTAEGYLAIEQVRHALQFQKLEGSKPLRMVRERLAGERSGDWEWHITIEAETLAVAAHINRAVRPVMPNGEAA